MAEPNIDKPVVLTVPEMIGKYSVEYGVDTKYAMAIAKCESGFNSTAKNPGSSATGVYQFLIGTWDHYSKKFEFEGDRLNAEDNIILAMKVMHTYGYSDWNASKHCWAKMI